jgi:hypothetical protein
MTSIKPSGGSIAPIEPGTKLEGPAGPAGARFSEQVTGSAPSQRPVTASAPGTTAAIVEGLRAGTIAPADAVRQLTEAAMARGGVPTALRGAVEAQMQAFLQRDPTVAALLRGAGASLRSAEE